MLTQKGKAVMTLGELVDNFCAEQGNLRESLITKYLIHAKWAWKDIFRTAVMTNKTQVFTLTNQHTLVLPNDCERVYNISVVDYCGNLHPLTFNPNANTSEIKSTVCSCKKCKGEGTLCGVVDAMKATQTPIVFEHAPFPSVTGYITEWVITNGCGDIQKVTKYPKPVFNGPVLARWEYNVVSETICNVETDEHGCIIPTDENLQTLDMNLSSWGFNSIEWNGFNYNFYGHDYNHKELLQPVYNYYGYWNFNSADDQIVHIFRNQACPVCNSNNCLDKFHDNANFGSIIVSYLTNGEVPGKEIIVPEYAYDAVIVGIMYRKLLLSDRRRGSLDEEERHYEKAKFKLIKYLNPIRLDDIYKLQAQKILW